MTEAAPDLSEFYAEQRQRGPSCTFGLLLAALDDETREAVRAACAAKDIQHAAIMRWLAKRNLHVGKSSISRHRNGECQCPR